MKQLMVFIAALSILFVVQAAFGQGSLPPDPNNREPAYVGRMRENREYWNRINRGMIANRDRQPGLVRRKYPDGKPYTKEEIARIEAIKKPNAADSAKYADFLKKSKTGLFRLFPFLACEEKNLIRVDGECADFIPGGWAYSFRAKDYSSQMFFDLKFEDGNLFSGSLLALGVLTALGDVPLENITPMSDGVKYLAELEAAIEQKESEKQIEQFAKGLESGGYQYSSKIKVEENKTYGLRVVAYRVKDSITVIPADNPRFFSYFSFNQSDKRDDITVVFRVVRKDEDNISILWKELSRTNAPKMVFPKETKTITVPVKSN